MICGSFYSVPLQCGPDKLDLTQIKSSLSLSFPASCVARFSSYLVNPSKRETWQQGARLFLDMTVIWVRGCVHNQGLSVCPSISSFQQLAMSCRCIDFITMLDARPLPQPAFYPSTRPRQSWGAAMGRHSLCPRLRARETNQTDPRGQRGSE